MAGFDRAQKRFGLKGLDLNHPVDRVEEGFYPILKNVRSYVNGTIQARVGLTSIYNISTNQTPARNFRRLNGVNGAEWVRFSKAGTVLAGERSAAAGSTSNLVTGLSTNPISLLPYRPEQSTDAWMIFADSAKMGKIKEDGSTIHQLGLDAPGEGNAVGMALPSPAIDRPRNLEIDFLKYANNGTLQAQWAQGGTAGLPTLVPSNRTNTTTTVLLFDSGTSGWACAQMNVVAGTAGIPGMSVGEVVTVGAETGVMIADIKRGLFGFGTTIHVTSYVYDGAAPGLISIQLATLTTDIEPDSLVQLADIFGAGEYVRVLSVIVGKDGRSTLRCKTTLDWSVPGSLDNLTPMAGSVRFYLASAGHVAGEAVTSTGMETVTTGTGTGTLTRTVTLDLSQLLTGLPTRDTDLMVASFRVTPISALTYIRVALDIDATAATQDFQHNALFYDIRVSDIQAAASGSASLLDTQTLIQRNSLIDAGLNPGPLNPLQGNNDTFDQQPISTDTGTGGGSAPSTPGGTFPDPNQTPSSTQSGSGDNQWSTIQWRLRDMVRVGTDRSRSIRNVVKVRFTIVSTAAVTVDFDSLFVRGGYSPDTRGALLPYSYACVARCSSTGVVSRMSPASRVSVFPERQRVLVTLAQYTAAAEVDKLDVYRYGGGTIGWHYVGTVANSATPVFTDDYGDDIISQNPPPPDVMRPWPQISTPVSGTATQIAGTSVKGSGFNKLWARGTEIRIAGIPYTIYRVISDGSTGVLELDQAANVNIGLTWEIQEPILCGQPFPVLVEYATQSGALFYLGCGDPLNPGRFYFSAGNNADGSRILQYTDLTSGSEPLVTIVVYNGLPVVFSSERAWTMRYGTIPDPETGAPIPVFVPSELAVGRGAWSRWAVAVGEAIFFLSSDGIYATNGGPAKCLTEETIGTLFPHNVEGTLGSTTNGIPAPNMTAANIAEMRLSVCGGRRWLYFDYLDANSARNTLVLDLAEGVWHYDTYTPGLTFHADEESPGQLHDIEIVAGGADATTAKLYRVLGSDDAGSGIVCQVRTASMDMGDPRARKLFGDTSVEIDGSGAAVTVTPGFDNHTTTLAPTVLSVAAGRVQTVIDFNSGAGQRAKNLSLDFGWTASASAKAILYFYEPSWINKPAGTLKRATDYDNKGNPLCKLVAGIYLEADTFGVTRSIILRSESAVIGTYAVNHNGKSTQWYPANPRVYAYELSLIGNDINEWDLYDFWPDSDPAPPLTNYVETPQMAHGLQGFQQLLDGYLSMLSNASVVLQVYVDGSVTPVTAVFVNESPNTAGARKKLYFRFPPTKGKLFRYVVTSASQFRLYATDCEVRVKPWGGDGSFRSINPFGEGTG